jgi:hypothetical protein
VNRWRRQDRPSDASTCQAWVHTTQAKERLLFVNKKKQKNFAILGCAGFTATGPENRDRYCRAAAWTKHTSMPFNVNHENFHDPC